MVGYLGNTMFYMYVVVLDTCFFFNQTDLVSSSLGPYHLVLIVTNTPSTHAAIIYELWDYPAGFLNIFDPEDWSTVSQPTYKPGFWNMFMS